MNWNVGLTYWSEASFSTRLALQKPSFLNIQSFLNLCLLRQNGRRVTEVYLAVKMRPNPAAYPHYPITRTYPRTKWRNIKHWKDTEQDPRHNTQANQ